jgi:hypothetical protein
MTTTLAITMVRFINCISLEGVPVEHDPTETEFNQEEI